ncbi:RmlC-like cupin [Mollisia scopiformis]|uniref:RmlC-like cupin n=1 Tax=Mollisia scopiformis TaxID=149040 RepID=A0A132B4V1_MOLSC|nr:RmlC-like cupin [Mollisia scopiformis]KUJ07438.1 RmlC-like cupin [Mollisia scopiformis]
MHFSASLFTAASLLANTVACLPGVLPRGSSDTTSSSSPTPSNLALFQQLVLVPSSVDRFNILTDADLLFSFNDSSAHPIGSPGVSTGQGGQLVRADQSTFPALYMQHGAMALGFIGPCGFNTPHVHPRANELFLVFEGRLNTSTMLENGGRQIHNMVNTLQMTIFPQGSVHMQFNPDCTPAMFVASFTGSDPGLAQIAQEFFGFSEEEVNAAVGGPVMVDGADVDGFRSKIPPNVAQGVESCLTKCGIKKK